LLTPEFDLFLRPKEIEKFYFSNLILRFYGAMKTYVTHLKRRSKRSNKDTSRTFQMVKFQSLRGRLFTFWWYQCLFWWKVFFDIIIMLILRTIHLLWLLSIKFKFKFKFMSPLGELLANI